MATAGAVRLDGAGTLRSARSASTGTLGRVGAFGHSRYRHALLLGADVVAAAVGLYLAFWLRFDGQIPPAYARLFLATAPLLVAIRFSCNAAARLHRWSFRLAGFSDALLVTATAVAGSILFVVVTQLLSLRLPRTVYALELFLAVSAFGGVRFLPRAALRWRSARDLLGAPRAIIVGGGHAAELLARDLRGAPGSRHRLVGVVDDDAHLARCRIDGLPVLGGITELPGILRRHRVATVLLADPCMAPERIREVVALCASSGVRFKIAPASWAHLEPRLSGAMLADIAPEALLSRACVAFDEVEIRRLVEGRRALVTGAGGSIGGELSRQLARNGVRQLVMVDMNENELYLRRLALAEEHPELDVRCEVADVREAEPLRRLGERYRPQDVFHAAAHKHVPLMEDAPAEAVKNNVFGTANAVRMAEACGAERFVLISTDKAVNPTSVMGATKRVAELVVRDAARRSGLRVTAVRFGNVLGSAGSIVPILKHQIARGGPVTITHPDCTRYFMTIPEAVGLVLLAGLGGHGDLCVLDMGAPIRIAELAESMIALSGHVPGDVRIVYTGLRPGEKLSEEVLTEQEERSLVVRDGIRVTRSPPPPGDLGARLEELRRLAHEGDREAIVSALRSLVPTYRARRARPDEAPAGLERVRESRRRAEGGEHERQVAAGP